MTSLPMSPSQYPPTEVHTLDASVLSKADASAEEKAAFAQKFLEVMTYNGVCKLKNHGVSEPVVENVFDQVERFFNLPLEDKKPTLNDPKKGQQRGWSPPGEEKTWFLESNRGEENPRFADNKESFDCGDPADKQFPNAWPTEKALPNYQADMDRFFFSCGNLCVTLLEYLASGMGLDRKLFSSRCTNEASTIRINHFPSIARHIIEQGQTARIWPHNDFGIISLVFPGQVPGLEIEDRANPFSFKPLPKPSPDEVVVLISETFQRWTNGAVRAGLHRVNKPHNMDGDMVPERYSLVYFCKADRHIDVGPLEEFLSEEKKAMYENLTALEYQAMRNAVHYPEPTAEEMAAMNSVSVNA